MGEGQALFAPSSSLIADPSPRLLTLSSPLSSDQESPDTEPAKSRQAPKKPEQASGAKVTAAEQKAAEAKRLWEAFFAAPGDETRNTLVEWLSLIHI